MFRRLARNAVSFAKRFGWLVSALLLWASFPPMGEKFDSFFALAPIIFLARRGDSKKSAFVWGLVGLVFWFATLSWMPAIVKNGGPLPLVLLGWFALSCYLALYFAAFGYFSSKIWHWARFGAYHRRLVAILFAEPVLWAGLEILRSNLFGGFAWNQLGVSAINAGFGAPARLGGVALVSALVFLVNGTFASIAERVLAPLLKDSPEIGVPRYLRSIETILPLSLVCLVFCASKPALSQNPSESDTLTVSMIQRNFPCIFKTQEADPMDVYSRLLGEVAMWKSDLVVLSESALSEFGDVDSENSRYFAKYSTYIANASALLAGGSRFSRPDKLYNSAALYLNPGAISASTGNIKSLQIYDKVHLVPFGEYIPFDKTFPWLQRFAPVGSCSSGEEKLLYLADGTPFACAICFEDTDSALMRRAKTRGAKFLAFITNDSWFSNSIEPEQHAWQSVARAIETGLPVVRVGNSGVSGIVLPEGECSWLSNENGRAIVDEQGTMVSRIAIGRYAEPPYVKLGDAPLLGAFAILIFAILFPFLRKVLRK